MATVNRPARTVWGLGDYHRFATATVWPLGPILVSACGVRPSHRVLDVAAGTGNVAIRAAQAGASVVAADLTPENFDAGRQAAQEVGVELEWREADAASLPFADAQFDIVTSCFGAMFAPDHRAVAGEMLRVCRPGGVIGMMNFTPAAAAGDFFRLVAAYAPQLPPDALPPLLWGTEDHVRGLLAERVQSLSITPQEYVESAPSARDYLALFKHNFGPMVAIYAGLRNEPARTTELDEAFLQFIERWNTSTGDGVRIPYEYLLVVARKQDVEA